MAGFFTYSGTNGKEVYIIRRVKAMMCVCVCVCVCVKVKWDGPHLRTTYSWRNLTGGHPRGARSWVPPPWMPSTPCFPSFASDGGERANGRCANRRGEVGEESGRWMKKIKNKNEQREERDGSILLWSGCIYGTYSSDMKMVDHSVVYGRKENNYLCETL